MNEFPELGFTEERQVGTIAQEVVKFFPELVQTDEKGYMYVDYSKFSPVLIQAVKEQQALINQLLKENESRQKQQQQMAIEIASLKAAIEGRASR